MSRRTEKRRYGKYNKFDVVYADFGKNPHGIQGGIRPGIIISCDASNHDGAPQVSVVPLSSKLKDIPVHVILNPKDVSGFGLSKISDFMPEDAQTISKGCIRAKSGTVIEDSGVREEIDRALIRQFDLLPVARKMVMEELANGQQTKKTNIKICRYSEGAEMYSMSVSKFIVSLAKDAKACYKVNQLVLVNLDIIDEYLETFHIVDDEFYK